MNEKRTQLMGHLEGIVNLYYDSFRELEKANKVEDDANHWLEKHGRDDEGYPEAVDKLVNARRRRRDCKDIIHLCAEVAIPNDKGFIDCTKVVKSIMRKQETSGKDQFYTYKSEEFRKFTGSDVIVVSEKE